MLSDYSTPNDRIWLVPRLESWSESLGDDQKLRIIDVIVVTWTCDREGGTESSSRLKGEQGGWVGGGCTIVSIWLRIDMIGDMVECALDGGWRWRVGERWRWGRRRGTGRATLSLMTLPCAQLYTPPLPANIPPSPVHVSSRPCFNIHGFPLIRYCISLSAYQLTKYCISLS